MSVGGAQVYNNPNGTASAVTSNYRKVNVPDSYRAFFQKIDDIQTIIIKAPEAYGTGVVGIPTTPQEKRRARTDNCSRRLLYSYMIYKDADSKNPFYYDYMTAFVKGDDNAFLQKINQAMDGHFYGNDNYMDPRLMNFTKNGIIGDYIKLANQDFYSECDAIWGGKDRLKGKAARIYIDKLSKNITKKDGYFSALDLAIIYSFGCYYDWGGDGTFGTINIDYQQSLTCLAQMEQQKYFSSLPPGATFLYKALKAYDLLQLGAAQKDISKLKQSSEIYIDLWQTASDAAKWNNIFDELVILAGYNGFNAGMAYCDNDEKVPDTDNSFHGTHFSPYFLMSVKLDLALQIIKCCAAIQDVNPNEALSNNQTPANYAAHTFRQFIDDWSLSPSQNSNKW